MTRRTAVLALACLAATPLGAEGGATSLTLFNSGTVLLRRTLPVSLPAGASTQSLPLGVFDPSSLTVLDPGVSLTGVRFDPQWSEDALLRRHLGDRFSFRRGNDLVTAQLLAMDPERWRLTDEGKVIFSRPGQLLWNPDDVSATPTTEVSLTADRARSSLRVMYQSSGGSWNVAYRLFLGAGGRIEASAVLNAGTLALADAEVQLLAGDIGRLMAAPAPMAMEMARKSAASANYLDGVPTSEAIGEAHLYTIPGKVSFTPGTQTVVPLFAPAAAGAERRLIVAGALGYYGSIGQTGDEDDVPVQVVYRLPRKLGTPFGDLPLPAGGISIFDADQAGRPQLIGMGAIGHTAPGEELNVATGTAFDVTAKRVQTEYSTTPTTTTPRRTMALIGYRVTLQNAKDSDVVVEVREDRGGEWAVVQSSVPAERRSSSRTVFLVKVAAKSTAVLTYRVRVVW